MSFSLTGKVLSKLGNKRSIEFMVDTRSGGMVSSTYKVSEEYDICNSTVFQVKVICSSRWPTNTNQQQIAGSVYVKFTSVCTDDPLSYTLNLTCEKFKIADKKFISDDGTWKLIGESTEPYYKFNISAQMILTPTKSPFEDLFSDDKLSDFELKGEGGSVKMHKAILAATSPVLRRMLSGPWRETTEGSVDLTGTSGTTLQHLKEYLYLHQLPSTGLEQLLVLAHYYMMTELEDKCIFKLICDFSPQNAFDLTILAAKHDITKMVLAIFNCVERGFLKVTDAKSLILKSDKDE